VSPVQLVAHAVPTHAKLLAQLPLDEHAPAPSHLPWQSPPQLVLAAG
jgi:hypothetical protein